MGRVIDCPNSHPDRLLIGVRIAGDASTGCVWITYPRRTHRMALWYPGYSARFDGIRIYDTRGSLVWSELDPPLDIGGGFVEVFLDRIPMQCRTNDYPYPWWGIPFSSYELSPVIGSISSCRRRPWGMTVPLVRWTDNCLAGNAGAASLRSPTTTPARAGGAGAGRP